MAEKMNELRLGITLALGAVSAALGWFGWLAVIFAVCLVSDWITGSLAAAMHGEWKSSTAREGCWHKLGSIVAVAASGFADILIGMIVNNIPGVVLPFNYTTLICPIVLVWYTVTELGSIVENAGKMGAPIPPFLKKAITALHDAVDAAGEGIGAGSQDKE